MVSLFLSAVISASSDLPESACFHIPANLVTESEACVGDVRNLDARLKSLEDVAPRTLDRFLNYPAEAAKGRFSENPLFWARGFDFTCASPWNSASGAFRAGTAISRRHIVFAKHYPLPNGTWLTFVGNTGVAGQYRLMAQRAVPDSDIVIGLLDMELTHDICPAKILPDDYERHIGNGNNMPTVSLSQRERAYLNALDRIPTNESYRVVRSWPPNDPLRAKFREEIITGDSGNPVFLIVRDRLVLLCCLQGGGGGTGPSLLAYRREIQKAMDALCPGYKLEQQSL